MTDQERALAQQVEPDHETRAELAEQQVVQLAEERDHYRNLWQKAQEQAEPVQEPFALPCPTPKACKAHCCSGNCIPRTAPPQRKPLTEKEIQAAWDSVDMRHPRGNETRIAFARAIEAAHGIIETEIKEDKA